MDPAGRGEAESLVGATIAGRYFVHQLLGSGGSGHVYKATPLGSDRPVALKLLSAASRSDPAIARRFEREAAAAARLRHPNAVEVVDFGAAEDGSAYLAMEFVPGRTLAQAIGAEAPFPAARAVHLLAQVLAALADAHAKGVIHRDLKPANVMIDPLRDAAGFVKVLDFGIAKLAEGAEPAGERLTGHDVVYGTPAYMSPEQIRGEPLDARSDLYSAGVVLFEMLTGRLPFDAPTPMAIAARHLTEPAPRPSASRSGIAVPPALEALLARALEKDPALRPPSAEAMRSGLLASLAALPEAARAPPRAALPPTEAIPRGAAVPRSRLAARARLAVAAAAAAAALGALLSSGRSPDEGPARAAPRPSAAEAPPAAAAPGSPGPVAPAPAGEAERAAPAPARVPAAPAAERSAAVRPLRRAAAPIRLVRGELNSVPTPPAGTGDGVLVLVATPWAEMELDGVPLGETPREVRVRAGAHVVRARHPDLGVREGRVVVGAGERTLWSARYEP